MANLSEPQILNMYTLSDTRPKIPEVTISRESYINFFEHQFEEDQVLCVDGSEGVGVTTALAMFAFRHGNDCVSYFNNGWSRHLLNPQSIVQSLLAQLGFYTKSDLNSKENDTSLQQILYKLKRATRNKSKYLYFVFDGFSNIPAEYVDVVRSVLQPLFNLDNARFLFSGTAECVRLLLPEGVKPKETNKILPFQRNEVEEYLQRVSPGMEEEDMDTFCKLSKGLARNLAILTDKLQKKGVQKIRDYFMYGDDDFFEEDYNWIEEQEDNNLNLLMALLTFSERLLNREVVMNTLKLDADTLAALLEKCKDYVEEEKGLIKLRSDDYRKYLRTKLTQYKSHIELLLIDQIEHSSEEEVKFAYLPALYKHQNNNKILVNYLTSDKVQHYLEEKKSQAALNEQCEYGYNACSDFETQAGAYFRFAINRSVSREIEKNELSDAEIEALIAIGDDEKAYELTQNVFLLEERLKCLLIIAQASQHLSSEMNQEIDAQITALADAIDYVHMPDKALELAKLMMPVKMEKALDIIDQVAKVTKDQQQIYRLYTAISLTFNNEGKTDSGNTNNASRADIVDTKIMDEGLRKMTTVMKSIMKDSTAQQAVTKMKELPASSQLNFMRYWIPDHRKRSDIGDAVEYAVKLVIETSTITMPKVTFLRMFCKPLPEMAETQVRSVVAMLDAVVANIKFPTVEYVRLMILVVSAVVKFDKEQAKNRLQNLYLEITDLKDQALQAHCKALLLRDFEKLGDKKDVEQWLSPSYELQYEIFDDVANVLKCTAYHMKVVEGPIKALVCAAPTFVKDIIEKMNTQERRDRAYLLAATEYVRQTNVKQFDWRCFLKLYDQITYDKSELYKPLLNLVDKVVEVNDKDDDLLKGIKDNYNKFIEVEQAEVVCYFLSNIYVWLCQNYTDTEFQQQVKEDLETAWNKITVPWLKISTGYNIANVLSKISMKIEAREYVAKTTELRRKELFSSLSCVTAYGESLDLYTHSLGIMIRSGLCGEEDLERYKTLLSYDDSEGDAMIYWSRVALEFYGAGDKDRFDKIITSYVSKPLDKFAGNSQKKILFNIAPALYMSLPMLFYDRVKGYDTYFKNACIENIARYVQTKYPYPEYTGYSEIKPQLRLVQKDYEILIDLIEHSMDEGFVFGQTEFITSSLEKSVGHGISREIQRVLFDQLKEVIDKRLPMEGGIQHKGYHIACMAMIEGKKPNGNMDAKAFKAKIDAVDNAADQAFLFAHVASYLNKVAERAEFMELALQKTEELNYMFDKFNRYSVCVQESFTATPTKTKGIATKVMDSLKANNNGTYSDYQRMIDMVRDHDEELADSMLEMVDDDPARKEYKERLKLRMQSNRKLDEAKNDLTKVKRLTANEQVRFFDRQMEILIKNKNVVRDVGLTQSIMKSIFDHPITDTHNAALYFMENVCQKNAANGKYKVLLRDMHNAIYYNLKLVLAIASGSEEKLERINRIMSEEKDEYNGMIQVGQQEEGVKELVDWYKKHLCDTLYIMDPHFYAEDMYIIKMLMDLNNNLKCLLLTHNHKKDASVNEVFQKGWNMYSSELPGRIEVKSCCYQDQQDKAPFHDRWWILYDADDDKYFGMRMASPSTLGSRITEISEMDDKAIQSAMKVFNRFFVTMARREEERVLKYDETVLR